MPLYVSPDTALLPGLDKGHNPSGISNEIAHNGISAVATTQIGVSSLPTVTVSVDPNDALFAQ